MDLIWAVLLVCPMWRTRNFAVAVFCVQFVVFGMISYIRCVRVMLSLSGWKCRNRWVLK